MNDNRLIVIVFEIIVVVVFFFSCNDNKTKLEHYPNKMLKSEIEYSRGLKNGIARYYDSTGALKSIKNFVDDTLQGTCIDYNRNGSRVVTHYERGILDGEYSSFHRNGNIVQHGLYRKGNRVGKWYIYDFYDSGKVTTEQYLVNFQGQEKVYYIKNFDSVNNFNFKFKSVEITFCKQAKLNETIDIDFQSFNAMRFDSTLLVIGGLDDRFEPIANVDTLSFNKAQLNYKYTPTIKGTNYIRGELIGVMIKKYPDSTLVEETVTYILPFEEAIEVN